ncbi:MAG: HEPN domain-containing protein [Nitrospirae bacterium]|nr:HEPN domain-containing protein [Nitrospirota bacterium]
MDRTIQNQIRRHIEMAEEDLRAADLLLEKDYFRAAVNRSFYACFQMVNGALLSQDIDPDRTRKRDLLSAFRTIFTFDNALIEPEYCEAYARLQALRRGGEKGNGPPPTREEAEWACREARRFVERLK